MGLIAKKPSPPEADVTFDLNFGHSNVEKNIIRTRILPAEWFRQSGVQLTWPHKNTDWAYMLEEVNTCYLRMAYEIAIREPLLIVTPEPDALQELLSQHLPQRATENITLCQCPTNDTWARDHAFLTRIGEREPELLDFGFNGWGNKFPHDLDNQINRTVYNQGVLKGNYEAHLDFVLEGGSIESDGEGTLLTTASCLLNPNRNPSLSKIDIEDRLCRYLGATRVLWLHHGRLEGDDTDGHIDTLARLCPKNGIAYVEDENDEELRLMEEEIKAFRTLSGKPYHLFPLPSPAPIEMDGERLPATYANFLIMNNAVLFPTYNQPDNDEKARQILMEAFHKYDVVGIDCRALIRQHGSLHCSAMQYPMGVLSICQ